MARLVFCEDNPLIQKLIAATLRSSGHDVSIVADGLDALKLVEHDPPDAIFTDLAMPGMDGYTLCAEIKARPHLQNVLIVIISASAQRHQIDDALARGAIDYLPKPFSTADLRAKVEETLARHSQPLGAIRNPTTEAPSS
ncbi:MAG: response regulator [Thermomicrobiales bacterium]